MATKNIIVLGGSYGGLSTGHYLLKHAFPSLVSKEALQLILISTSCQVMCRPACPRAVISDEMFAQNKLFVSIPELFQQYPESNFRFVQGSVTKLDHVGRTVLVALVDGSEEKLDFFSLVIATGASTSSPLLGLNQDSEFLKLKWTEFRKALPHAKKIVIAGGGPAGIEIAGELGEHLNGRAGWLTSKSREPKVSIIVLSASPKILPTLRPAIAEQAEAYLADVGVKLLKNMRVQSVNPELAGTDEPGSKATLTLTDGTTIDADIYIPATGTRPNTKFVHQSLRSKDGRVDTNPSTFRVENAGPRIYAIGDVANSTRPAIHLILDGIPVLCANIKRDLRLAIEGDDPSIGEDRVFKEDLRETQLVPIGKSKGVGAAMGWKLPSFLVWLIKGRDYWLWTTDGLWSGKQWAREA